MVLSTGYLTFSKALVLLIFNQIILDTQYSLSEGSSHGILSFSGDCLVNIKEGPVSGPTPITNCSAMMVVNMTMANMSMANMTTANMSTANMTTANMSIANMSMANMSMANMTTANMSMVNMTAANMSMANMSMANMSMANMSMANMSMANMSMANMSMANMSMANMSMANMTMANMSMANMTMANMTAANMTVANTGNTTTMNNSTMVNSTNSTMVNSTVANNSPIVDNTSIELNYTLVNGNSNATFSIDNSGIVYQVKEVDREIVSYFSILVQAMTSQGQVATTYLNVTVDDINDNYPEVLSEMNFSRNITEADLDSKQTSFYQVEATDSDLGKNSELKFSMEYYTEKKKENYTLYDHKEKTKYSDVVIQDIVRFKINVSDLGDPSFTTAVTGSFFLNGSCPVQKHSINSTGHITSLFLCLVELEASNKLVKPGDSLNFTCRYLSNSVYQKVIFSHNKRGLLTDSLFYNFTNATEKDSGFYTCKVITDFGILRSPRVFILISGVVKLSLCDLVC